MDDLLEHPYLAPHVDACRQRIAALQAVPNPEAPLPTPPEQTLTEITEQDTPVEPVSLEFVPTEEASEELIHTHKPSSEPIHSSDPPRSSDLARAALRKSAESLMRNGERLGASLLRNSADSAIRKSGSVDGFGPEPSASPQVVIGSKRGGAFVDTHGEPCEEVGLREETSGGERGTGEETGGQDFAAARVQQLNAMALKDGMWMEGDNCSPTEPEVGSLTEREVKTATDRSAQQDRPVLWGAARVTDSRRALETDSSDSGVTSQGGALDGPDRRSAGQTAADRTRQPGPPTTATEVTGVAVHDSMTSAMRQSRMGDSDSLPVARKEPTARPGGITALQQDGVDVSTTKQRVFQKRVAALGVPAAPARTPSKGSSVSSGSSTPLQPSPKTPLVTPKQNRVPWGASPISTLKSPVKPQTPLTEPKPSNPKEGSLTKRPTSAPPKSTLAAAKRMTSATLPGRPLTAAQTTTSRPTRGTIPGAKRDGLTATGERRETGERRFNFAAARIGLRNSESGQERKAPGRENPEVGQQSKPPVLGTIREKAGLDGPVRKQADSHARDKGGIAARKTASVKGEGKW